MGINQSMTKQEKKIKKLKHALERITHYRPWGIIEVDDIDNVKQPYQIAQEALKD